MIRAVDRRTFAAAHAAGANPIQVDHYEAGTCIWRIAAVVVHSAPSATR